MPFYEAGLLNGASDTTFSPNSPLTEAQLLVLTARVYHLRQGGNGVLPALPVDPENYAYFMDSFGRRIAALADASFSVDNSSHSANALLVTFQTPPQKTLYLKVGFPSDGMETILTGQFVPGAAKSPGTLNGLPIYSVSEDHYAFSAEGTIGAEHLCMALIAYQLSEDIFSEYWKLGFIQLPTILATGRPYFPPGLRTPRQRIHLTRLPSGKILPSFWALSARI